MSSTYNHRKGSTFAAAMRRSAERRRCPTCGRKSAITRVVTDCGVEWYCRWDDCGFTKTYDRFWDNDAGA